MSKSLLDKSFIKLLQLIPINICRTNTVFSRHYKQTAGNVKTLFEIIPGVGGSESSIFGQEMFTLYSRYFTLMKWPYRVLEYQESSASGILQAKFEIDSADSFAGLIQEAGVHRVQRVPKTEKYGRLHTSTVSISVVPKSLFEIKLNDKDIEVQTKRSSGPGGQHVNKTETAIRLVHNPTGIAVECQESRHQIENKKKAMEKLLEKLKETELDKVTSELTNIKKAQMGRGDRNEKIRTYNFPQDRITDHRIGKNYHNLRGLFSGDTTVLSKMIADYNSKQ